MAVLSRNDLNTQADNRFNDNTSGDISPADSRNMAKDLADSCLNKSTDAGVLFPVMRRLTGQTIAAGSSTKAHTAGHPAKHVNFTGSDGWPIQIPWKPTPGSESTSITLSVIEEVTDVTIDIIAYTI